MGIEKFVFGNTNPNYFAYCYSGYNSGGNYIQVGVGNSYPNIPSKVIATITYTKTTD